MPRRTDGREGEHRFTVTVTKLARSYVLPNLFRGPPQIAWLTWRVWHHLGTAQHAKRMWRQRRRRLQRRIQRIRTARAAVRDVN